MRKVESRICKGNGGFEREREFFGAANKAWPDKFCGKEGASSALILGCHVCYCHQRPGGVIREISAHSFSQGCTMTDKVEKLTKRLNSKKLAKTYPRVERKNTTLSPEYLSDDVSRYYPPAQADTVYAAAKEPPFEEYELSVRVSAGRATKCPARNRCLI